LELCYKPNIEISPNLPLEAVLNVSNSDAAHPLVAEYGDQDSRFGNAFFALQQAIEQKAFPAASVAVTHHGKLVALKAMGRFTYEPDALKVEPGNIFDLASVSKVVATTSMAMILYERGILDLDMPISSVVPEFARGDSRKSAVTIHMLLAHSSGLPAYEKLFLKAKTRDELLAAAFAEPLVADPGTHAEYSDIGFIILGVALERLAGEPLDRFSQREVFGPLGMVQTAFNPPAAARNAIVPTVDDRAFRHRIMQGEVQDENASVLGGVAAHAGVFSTAKDLAIFVHAMLQGGPPILRPETVRLFTARESSPSGTSRALGWDTPSTPSQSGRYFSAHSFGHLGYTGTSLWIDQNRQFSVVLLTNRTWPDCSNQAIKQVRPQFHNAIAEALGINI
jgi:serine-type D-Ala-D-Ala carboxypeptidase